MRSPANPARKASGAMNSRASALRANTTIGDGSRSDATCTKVAISEKNTPP